MLEIHLAFEFVPSAFAVQTLGESGKWIDQFATDANILPTVRLPVATGAAYGVRLLMSKAHPTQGVLGGHSLYGVRSFKVLSPSMRAVLEPCAIAAKSSDARDKYFAVGVGSFDPAPGVALRSELPALASAGAALGEAVMELAEACKKQGAAFKSKAKSSRAMSGRKVFGGVEIGEQESLFGQAKKTIIAARGLLQ